MPIFLTLLYVLHTIALSAWFGTQIYSVLLVQRHPAQDEDPMYFEDFSTRMAQGTRWNIVSIIAFLVPTWIAMAWIRAATEPALGPVWWTLVVLKSAVILVTVAVFVFLSWHVWPVRIFALVDELPAVRRQFYRLSVAILCGAAIALVLGVLEQSVGTFVPAM